MSFYIFGPWSHTIMWKEIGESGRITGTVPVCLFLRAVPDFCILVLSRRKIFSYIFALINENGTIAVI